MGKNISLASEILDKISGIMYYELMISTSGIREADSNFMWATTFRAPVGINFIHSNVSIILFLPEGSEYQKDENLFFNRVGARLQDGLWQVRRSLSELSDVYGSALHLGMSTFRSLMVNYSYIHRGRYNAHFTFNSKDLMDISSLIVTYSDVADGYRVEYMRKLYRHSKIYDWINSRDKVAMVTLQVSRPVGNTDLPNPTHEMPIILSDFLDERGIKGMALAGDHPVPEILETSDVSEFSGKVTAFWAKNEVITQLVSRLATDFIVLYGLYGIAYPDAIRLVIPVPVQQTSALMRLLKGIMTDFTKWDLKLLEVTDYQMEYVMEE